MALLPITAVLECDHGICRETLEVRLVRPGNYLSEVEAALEENGWSEETDGYKCPLHKWEPRAA